MSERLKCHNIKATEKPKEVCKSMSKKTKELFGRWQNKEALIFEHYLSIKETSKEKEKIKTILYTFDVEAYFLIADSIAYAARIRLGKSRQVRYKIVQP